MTYHYRAYGLIFASEIPLPFDSVARKTAPDVTVVRGDVPRDLGPDTKGRGLWWAKPGEFLIRHLDGSAVYVRDGAEVRVDGQDSDVLRFLLTGSALSALLQQRGIVTLHASAVLIAGQAVAFFGNSGAGKSTTAAALAARGCPLISDDVLALHVDASGSVLATPAYPRIGLWEATTKAMGIDVSAAHQRLGGVDKYLISPTAFADAPVRLSHMFNLIPHIEGNYDLSARSASEVFAGLAGNTHRRRSAMALGKWPDFFHVFDAAARQVTAYELVRPREGARFDELVRTVVDRVTQDLQGAP